MLAQAIGYEAIKQGFVVCYRSIFDLVRDFLADDYSIADMLSWPWVAGRSSAALAIEELPNLKAWHERVAARPAVERAMAKARDFAASGLQGSSQQSEEARKVLFGQRARR